MNVKDLNTRAKELIEKIKKEENTNHLALEFEDFIKEVSKLLGHANPLVLNLKNQLHIYQKRITLLNTMKNEILKETNKMKEYRINAGLPNLS